MTKICAACDSRRLKQLRKGRQCEAYLTQAAAPDGRKAHYGKRSALAFFTSPLHSQLRIYLQARHLQGAS